MFQTALKEDPNGSPTVCSLGEATGLCPVALHGCWETLRAPPAHAHASPQASAFLQETCLLKYVLYRCWIAPANAGGKAPALAAGQRRGGAWVAHHTHASCGFTLSPPTCQMGRPAGRAAARHRRRRPSAAAPTARHRLGDTPTNPSGGDRRNESLRRTNKKAARLWLMFNCEEGEAEEEGEGGKERGGRGKREQRKEEGEAAWTQTRGKGDLTTGYITTISEGAGMILVSTSLR